LNTDTATNDVAVVIRLPRDLRDALKRRAASEDRSVASLLRMAVRAYVQTDEGGL
jgi:plasmid stability protein